MVVRSTLRWPTTNNTLVDYRYTRRFNAKAVKNGSGKDCTQQRARILILPVP